MTRKPRRTARKTAALGRQHREQRTEFLLLQALEENARASLAELAEQVGLSKTPTWARIRQLEQRRIVTGYRAEIDPAAVGLNLSAFIHVTIKSTHYAQFERAVIAHPAVLECYTTAGEADYLLHVLAADVAALDAVLRFEIAFMPGVERVSTTIGLKTIKRRGRIMDCLKRD
jgi:Lrp/AsnC family leucine-responsive transcriptional regulator